MGTRTALQRLKQKAKGVTSKYNTSRAIKEHKRGKASSARAFPDQPPNVHAQSAKSIFGGKALKRSTQGSKIKKGGKPKSGLAAVMQKYKKKGTDA